MTVNLGVLPSGEHEYTLTVTDKDGASATAKVRVDVGGATGTVDADREIETEAAPGCDFGVKLDTGESDFVSRVNDYRVFNSRERVWPSPTLTEAALEHARWLRDNDKFDHTARTEARPPTAPSRPNTEASSAKTWPSVRGPHPGCSSRGRSPTCTTSTSSICVGARSASPRSRQRAGARRAVDLRRPARRRALPPGRRRRTETGRGQLEAGRLQRRRRVPRGRRLPAALAADRLGDEQAQGLRDAPRAGLLPDRRPGRTKATWCSGCSRTGR